MTAVTILSHWLHARLQDDARDWLDDRLARATSDFKPQEFYVSFGLMPRKLGKSQLDLSGAERTQAEQACAGWRPDLWNISDAGRVLLLLSSSTADPRDFTSRFEDLCRNADVGELVALYRGLPLYPQGSALVDQAAEGLRSNIQVAFEAIAHDNPYPRQYFDQAHWNQMVLKTLFIGTTLNRIQGLDECCNPDLAATLRDYVNERLAAGRAVSLELWRCLGPFAEDDMLDQLEQRLHSKDPRQQQAAALALAANPAPRAKALLKLADEMKTRIEQGQLTWQSLLQTPE